MKKSIRTLHLEDDPADAELIKGKLHAQGLNCRITWAQDRRSFEAALQDGAFDLILCDYHLPDFDGLGALTHAKARHPEVPVIFVTGTIGEEEAVKCLRQGATDYLLKHQLERLASAVTRALVEAEELRRRRQAETELRESEARYRRLLASTTDYIYTVRVEHGRAVETVHGQNSEAITGYTPEEYAADRMLWIRMVPESDRAQVVEHARQALAGETPPRLEHRILHKDGSIRWIKDTIVPRKAADGHLLAYDGLVSDITERKRAEEGLAGSLSLLEAALESTADGLLIVDRDGRVERCNQKFVTMWQIPADVLETRDDTQLLASVLERLKDPAGFFAKVKELYAEPDAVSSDLLEFKDGRVFERFSQPQRVGGRSMGRVWSFRDITARMRAEAALRESEERYRLLFERAPDLIFALAPTGAITTLNHAFEAITGWPAAEWLGRPFHPLIHSDNRSLASDWFQLLLRGERAPAVELHMRTAAGGFRDIEITGFPSRLSGGQLEVQGIGRDVTERNVAEHLRREQNEILSNSHEGVMIVNLANKVSLWNHGAETIFGWPAADALGRPPEELLGLSDPGVVPKLHAVAAAEEFWNGELRAKTRDGRTLVVDCRSTLVSDKAGRPRARLNFLTDITEKKLLEERFLHAQRIESIGMLAAGIAHDLNNVLAPIIFAAPMLRGSLPAERDRRILDTLETSAQRGAGLVKQILGFAHTTSGEFRSTQVKHLARDIVGVIAETFPKSIEFRHDVPADLWPVQGNPTQIHQVLMNLCVNARDAMPQGGVLSLAMANRRLDAAEVSKIPGSRPGDWVELTVSDTGTGIAPDVLEKIWTPFYTTKGVGRGTGLGLTTIRSIVANHHGFISLDTAVGLGTTFTVFLPALVSVPPKVKSATPFAQHTGSGELVLVVDDDTAIHSMVAVILQKSGYRVQQCHDGFDALTFFNAQPAEVALVITDVDMPRVGGVALARGLLQIRPDIPILAMSGLPHHDAESPDIPVIRSLARGFLAKPFGAEELLAVVHQLLHPAAAPQPA
jgi:PAS domain S-box-containing protein